MRAGYDWQIYRQLCEARNCLSLENQMGRPFVSVAGPNYTHAKHKILYIGKSPWATEYEGKATATREEYEDSLSWSTSWLDRQAVPSTAFWKFSSELVQAVMPSLDGPPTSYIAWSNLAKVAQIGKGAPDRMISKAMSDAECATLKAELCAFAPNLVVLVSNDAVWDVATRVFGGREHMDAHEDGTWTRSHPGNFKLYWTRHPQGKALNWRSQHAAKIAQLI